MYSRHPEQTQDRYGDSNPGFRTENRPEGPGLSGPD